MQDKEKVLIVGTTSDYIEWIRNTNRGLTLFITDPAIRKYSNESSPLSEEEILCDLTDYQMVLNLLEHHLAITNSHLSGVTCFDCESMELAAFIADRFSLSYPSIEAIKNCRNKYLTKTLWHKYGLQCPDIELIHSPFEAKRFFHGHNSPCVIKPLTGSGSELIFYCQNEKDCEENFEIIEKGLYDRQANRLYSPSSSNGLKVLIESFVTGDEYSCDFIVDKGSATLIRITRKIIKSQDHFGTALGYLLLPSIPDEIDESLLLKTLYKSAASLGIDRSICMVDFIINQGRIILLELSPRPGGDCLPFLLRRCRNLDILSFSLDFSRQKSVFINKQTDSTCFMGLRLLASRGGILKKLDVSKLIEAPIVREIHLVRQPGHQIVMPPDDYDSWLLGHIIIKISKDIDIHEQCVRVLDKINMEIE